MTAKSAILETLIDRIVEWPIEAKEELARSMQAIEKKHGQVAELGDLIKSKSTILLASIKNLPASQFQEVSKRVRGMAIVKVPRKNLILRAIDNSEKESVKKLKEQIKSDVAILFSNEDTFELASFLIENKSPSKAKAGQIASAQDGTAIPGQTAF